jgi:hypothetical protein
LLNWTRLDNEEQAVADLVGDTQNGKIKNKILKLTATVLKLQAQAAQGKDVAAKLQEEQTKLQNNIAQDEAEAGNPSTALSFDATVG